MPEISSVTYNQQRDVEKLDGSKGNYFDWSWSLELVLEQAGLMSVVDGTQSPPAEGDTAKSDLEWKRKSRQAYTIIALSHFKL